MVFKKKVTKKVSKPQGLEPAIETTLETYEEFCAPDKELPIRKAFTIERKDGNWTMTTLLYKDDKLVEIERTEPNIKQVAIEKFKIEAFKYWSKYE